MSNFYITDAAALVERSSQPANIRAGYGYIWAKNSTPNTLYFTDDAGTDWPLEGSISVYVPSIALTQSNRTLTIHNGNSKHVHVIGQYSVGWINSNNTKANTVYELVMQDYQNNFSNNQTYDTAGKGPIHFDSGSEWIVPKIPESYNILRLINYADNWYELETVEKSVDISAVFSSSCSCNFAGLEDLSIGSHFSNSFQILDQHKMAIIHCLGAAGFGQSGGQGGYAKTVVNLSGQTGNYLYMYRGVAINSNSYSVSIGTHLRGGEWSNQSTPWSWGPGGGASFVTIGDAATFATANHTFLCIGAGGGGGDISSSFDKGGSGNSNNTFTGNPEYHIGHGGMGYYLSGNNNGAGHGVGGTGSSHNGHNLDISTPILGSDIVDNEWGKGAGDSSAEVGLTHKGGGGYGGGGDSGTGGGAGGSFGDVLDERDGSGIVTIFTDVGYSNTVGQRGLHYDANNYPTSHGAVIVELFGNW